MSPLPLLRPTFVAFDVASDSRRNLLRLELSLHGDWVQRSVWLLLPTTRSDARAVAATAAGIIDSGDRLLVVRPCLTCLSRVITRSGGSRSPNGL